MLWLERAVVRSLTSPTLDEPQRRAVEDYVDSTLRSMPEHLRLGVAAESVLFGIAPRIACARGADPRQEVRRRVRRWAQSRLDPLRQYVRLLQSLVLFAENELVPAER